MNATAFIDRLIDSQIFRANYDWEYGNPWEAISRVWRLWNIIDHLQFPEPLWQRLEQECPWAHYDGQCVGIDKKTVAQIKKLDADGICRTFGIDAKTEMEAHYVMCSLYARFGAVVLAGENTNG